MLMSSIQEDVGFRGVSGILFGDLYILGFLFDIKNISYIVDSIGMQIRSSKVVFTKINPFNKHNSTIRFNIYIQSYSALNSIIIYQSLTAVLTIIKLLHASSFSMERSFLKLVGQELPALKQVVWILLISLFKVVKVDDSVL